MKTIRIDGLPTRVIVSLSCGPGETPHTYEFEGGYVYEVAGKWILVNDTGHRRWVRVEAD